MIWEPITDLVWEEHNEAKCREHGISRDEVEALLEFDEYAVTRHRRYPGQFRLIGPTPAGRWLTVVVAPLGAGRYRLITGWVASRKDRAEYRELMPPADE